MQEKNYVAVVSRCDKFTQRSLEILTSLSAIGFLDEYNNNKQSSTMCL